MIHRLVYNILFNGIAALKADVSLLDDLFKENYVLEASELAAIKTYFGDHDFTVINGYARRDTAFPAVAIVLGEERESQNFIGDDGGLVNDPEDPFYLSDIESAFWTHNYPLLIYTDHPDLTAYYYEIIKYVLLAGLNTLIDDGASNFAMSGTDLAPDLKYLPEHLYGRELRFSCQREFQRVNGASRLGKAIRVSGIHVDSSGSLSDVGDVKTNVTTYGIGEEDDDE